MPFGSFLLTIAQNSEKCLLENIWLLKSTGITNFQALCDCHKVLGVKIVPAKQKVCSVEPQPSSLCSVSCFLFFFFLALGQVGGDELVLKGSCVCVGV